jgi:LysR family transcriptional regulator, hydrogen peroxide-inducible genes activator
MDLKRPAFTLRQLQYFVAVAETGSFRVAAERCFVAQPSLSSQLAELEAALGVTLLARGPRRATLTRPGQDLLHRARALLVGAEDLRDAAAAFADPLSGTLRIGVIPTISPYLLPVVAPALLRAFPELKLRWDEARTPELVAKLASAEIDAALLAREAELGELEQAVIAEDRFLLATHPADPLGRGRGPLAPGALRGQPLLLLDDGHCLRDQALAFCSRSRAKPNELDFRATSLPTLVQMVASGAGATLLPELAVAAETQHADLRLRRFTAPEPKRTLVLAWRRHSPLGPALRQMAEVLAGSYPRPPKAR